MNLTIQNYDNIPDELKNTICFTIATNPTKDKTEVADLVSKQICGLKVDPLLVEYVGFREFETVKNYKLGDIETVQQAILMNKFPHASLYGRMSLLHEVIALAKDGMVEPVMTPRGEIIEVVKRDLKSVLEAVKQVSSLMERVENQTQIEDDTIIIDTYEVS